MIEDTTTLPGVTYVWLSAADRKVWVFGYRA